MVPNYADQMQVVYTLNLKWASTDAAKCNELSGILKPRAEILKLFFEPHESERREARPGSASIH